MKYIKNLIAMSAFCLVMGVSVEVLAKENGSSGNSNGSSGNSNGNSGNSNGNLVIPQVPCEVTDMTFNSANSNQCFGPVNDNDNVGFINSNFGLSWTSLLKYDVPNSGVGSNATGSYLGIDFALNPVSGQNGSWTLSWDDNGNNILPQTFDLAAVLKGSNNFNGYLFSGLTFNDAPASGVGTWDINFFNNGGNVPDISHFSLYIRGDLVPPCDGNGCNPDITVPEPTSLLLMGAGLIGFSLARRRKSA